MLKNKINILVFLSLLFLNGCVFYNFRYNGVFKKPYNKYKVMEYSKNPLKKTIVKMQDDTEIIFRYLGGYCGASVEFIGIIIPIIPTFSSNTCEIDGLEINYGVVGVKNTTNIFLQLKYNNTTHNPFPNKTNVFPIPNFKEFKKAKDKTLIIHKKRDDGTIITKEIPFDWKIVVHSVVVP